DDDRDHFPRRRSARGWLHGPSVGRIDLHGGGRSRRARAQRARRGAVPLRRGGAESGLTRRVPPLAKRRTSSNVARTSVRAGGMNPAPHFFTTSENWWP